MLAPPPGKYGTMTSGFLRGPNFTNVDLSVFKNMTITERLRAQFRAEFFNVFNTTNLSSPSGNPSSSSFGCSCTTPNQANTNPVLGSGGARKLQLGLKLLF